MEGKREGEGERERERERERVSPLPTPHSVCCYCMLLPARSARCYALTSVRSVSMYLEMRCPVPAAFSASALAGAGARFACAQHHTLPHYQYRASHSSPIAHRPSQYRTPHTVCKSVGPEPNRALWDRAG
eukprot:2690440-Rhodomonas_salina.1